MLRIPKETAERLDALKAKGQSDAGIIEELIDLAERAGFGRVADKLGLMRPSEGPPLPKELGVTWKERRGKK